MYEMIFFLYIYDMNLSTNDHRDDSLFDSRFTLVKRLYTIRNRNIKKYGEVNADRQARINELIRNNQEQAVSNETRKHGTGTKG